MPEQFPSTNSPKEEKFLSSRLEIPGADIEPDPFGEADAYILKFRTEGAITTIRIVFNDYSGSDVVITNMTTLPISMTGLGYGSSAVRKLLDWAHANNVNDVRAVQVQAANEKFWKEKRMDSVN